MTGSVVLEEGTNRTMKRWWLLRDNGSFPYTLEVVTQ